MPKPINHTCHHPDCFTSVAPSLWGCKKHWDMVPADLKRRLKSAYQPGQEITKRVSSEYLDAAYAIRLYFANLCR